MQQKELIKKALADAEKDQQTKEVERIKQIVQSHLEKIDRKVKERETLDTEIVHLRKDLEDLKAGRLDRICERQEKDEKAREVRIVIVKKIEREYVPMKPWYSPYEITWAHPYIHNFGMTGLAVTTTTANASTSYFPVGTAQNAAMMSITATGNNFANFAGGTYEVGNRVINL